MSPLRRMILFAPPPWRRMAVAVALGALAVLCGIGLMATAGYLIARAAERPEVLSLTVAIVAVRAFGLGRPIARYLERLCSHDAAFRVLARARSRAFERIEPLAPAELDAFRRGDLLSRMVGDVDALQGLYLRALAPPAVALVAGGVAVAAAVAILPAAGAVLAVGLLTGATVVPALCARMGRWSRASSAARGALTADLVELLRGAPELVVYGGGEAAVDRIRESDRAVVRMSRLEAAAAGAADCLSILVVGVTVAAVVAVSVQARAAGRIDGVLVATLALLAIAAFDAIAPLPQAARELSGVSAAGRRVFDLVGREPRVRDPARPLPAPSGAPTVAFEDVVARYAPDQPAVLDGLSFELGAGRKLGMVGPSGCGKTTVANLMLRFLDPVAGRVTLDGRDLRDHLQSDVRAAIAVAGQDSHLFSTSIRENLRLARPDATDAELERALARARVLDWVRRLPDGLDTLVGEEGTAVSGGQRQRLAVARVLLTDAPVIVLDEPTAHLDDATARALVDDVLDELSGRAVLLITHRPDGLERMDAVLRLDARGESSRWDDPRPRDASEDGEGAGHNARRSVEWLT